VIKKRIGKQAFGSNAGYNKAGVAQGGSVGEALWIRFFKLGILFGFIGWTLGAINLAIIALKRSYFELSMPLILSHVHIQVFGWVGLLIMGFAYQAFPRFKYVSLWSPRLASISFWMAIAGISLAALSIALLPRGAFFVLAICGTIIELAACTIFALVIIKTIGRALGTSLFWEKYIFASLSFFLVQALVTPPLLYLIGDALLKSDISLLIGRVATFVPPYQDIQLFGFTVMMIFGVSQRFIPTVFDTASPSKRLGDFSFYALLAFILLSLIFHFIIRSYKTDLLRTLAFIPYLGLLASSLGVIVNTGVLKKAKNPTREFKFVRAAYLWLLTAIVLLFSIPLYIHFAFGTFSHNYFGACRHALTVGFISLMIMGVASRATSIMSGVKPKSSLMVPFVLVNAGNIARVVSQILIDFAGRIPSTLLSCNQFILGTSGFIQVIGFSLWAYEMWSTTNEGLKRGGYGVRNS
jgi:hypothetical protein